MTPASLRHILDTALRLLAAVLLASLTVAAWHDVTHAWDAWSYHLPFAARIAGIADATTYAFGRGNQARFEGFPLFAEALQGLLWRITGRAECANFVALAAVPGLALFLRRLFAVPFHLSILALLAVPLVQIHATATYVDLPANACATMLLLLAYRCVVARRAPSVRAIAGAGALAVAAANTKFQLVPIVLAASAVLLACSAKRDARRNERLLLIAALVPLVLATPIKNAVRHGNPVWPVEIHLLGKSLPHVETAYASSPVWLESSPRPVRFAASVLEVDARPIAEHARWSIDQWTPSSERSYRMGGFFGAYVIANIAGLVLAAWRRRSREATVAAWFAGGATVLTSVMPQSHELRYYLYWMLLLVALNLVVWAGDVRARTSVGVVAASALAIVAWSTGGTYLYASGESVTSLVAAKVDRAAIERIPDGERACVSREPWTFLYAPLFNAGRSYSIQEAETPEDCAGARPIE